VFDRALPLAEQGGQSALAAEAFDYSLGGVRFLFHRGYPNKFFVNLQARSIPEFSATSHLVIRLVMMTPALSDDYSNDFFVVVQGRVSRGQDGLPPSSARSLGGF
jgi:hypothetical protein